jgi:radical SAM-linked protein
VPSPTDPTDPADSIDPIDPIGGPRAAPAVQRWRLTWRRRPDAPELDQRAALGEWEAAMVGSGLPVVMSDAATPRPRLAFGAPLGIGIPAERELADLYLWARRRAWEVRGGLERTIPAGHELVRIDDVWLGAPALAGRVAAADYRIELAPVAGLTADRLAAAASGLIGATELPRVRRKGSGEVRYDLRPLVAGVAVRDPGPPIVVATRTVFHVERGTGRPEEVVAALADALGVALEVRSLVRERVVLVEELAAPPA